MLIYHALICILLVTSVPGQMHNKQQVCMDVEDACSIPDLRSGQNTAQGPPGKKGPIGLSGQRGIKGSKGSTGVKGSPGRTVEINHDRVQAMIVDAMPNMLCGGTFYFRLGETKSVNYWFPGGHYLHNINCTFHLRTTSSAKLRIAITEIDIESDSSCRYDHIAFYNGPVINSTHADIMKRCGTTEGPTTVLSGTNIVTGWFKSDGSNSGQGFKSTIKAV